MMRYQLISLIVLLCVTYTFAQAQSDSTKNDKHSSKNCEPQLTLL